MSRAVAGQQALEQTATPLMQGQAILTTAVVPHRGTQAILVRAPFDAPIELMRRALTSMDRFPDWVSILRKGRSDPAGPDRWNCLLAGKLGIWKVGVSIEMRFVLRRVDDDEFVMEKYLGGTFADLHFHHQIVPVRAGRQAEIASIYHFDLSDFALVRHISAFRNNPAARQEIQMVAAVAMTRGLVEMVEHDAGRAV